MKELIRKVFLDSGADAVGFTIADTIPDKVWNRFETWLTDGFNAGMAYMTNYPDIRKDPRLLMPNAKTIISLAFNYAPSGVNREKKGMIANYAFYEDYHKALRKLIKKCLHDIFNRNEYINWRICIDSAPVLERFWAVKSGIGFIGDNGMLIVPGTGSRVFLAEVILDIDIEPDKPMTRDCGHCGKCKTQCPANAILPEGKIDCNRCISYLTIEHKGKWNTVGSDAMATPAGKDTIFGCDKCVEICPWNNSGNNCGSSVLSPIPEILKLDRDMLLKMDETEFNIKFGKTPLGRSGYEGIKRNIGIQ